MELPTDILTIAHEVVTQDNRITAVPVFIVQQKRRIFGVDPDWTENITWLYDGDELGEDEQKHVEAKRRRGEEVNPEYHRIGYIDQWEFVTACLTEKGCAAYIAINGHNLREPRIYVESGYRNLEWKAIREFLLSVHAQADQVILK